MAARETALTGCQQSVLAALRRLAAGTGRAPNTVELGRELGLAPGTVRDHLYRLARRGVTEAAPGVPFGPPFGAARPAGAGLYAGNVAAPRRAPAAPTPARPGSPQKLEVLEARAAAGELLHHPGDAGAPRRGFIDHARHDDTAA
jgi:hypothetical protein